LRVQWNELFKIVHSEKLGEIAAQFDRVHSVHRALEVGALNHILPPAKLRPYLVRAIERGIERERELEEKSDTNNLTAREVGALAVAGTS